MTPPFPSLRRARAVWLLVVVVSFATVACSRGPLPPSPSIVLTPSIVGVLQWEDGEPLKVPLPLRDGSIFDGKNGSATRLRNWPDTEPDDLNIVDGNLLLGGDDATLGPWFQLTGPGPNDDGCWMVWGGAFDMGDSIRFATGLEVPKADDFEIRTEGHDIEAFPARAFDGICVDADGRARYFQFTPGL